MPGRGVDTLSSVMAHTGPDGSRSIRSYIRRQGRITRAQARARTELWARYGVEIGSESLDVERIFGRDAPLVVEVGFGMGHALTVLAARHADWNFIGIEVYRAGIGALLAGLHEQMLTNVRVCEADAVEVFEYALAPQSISTLMIYFPDPWPKRRHHKRRLVRQSFLDLAASRLIPAGRLLIATDWTEYATEMLEALEGHPQFVNAAETEGFALRPVERPTTRFEARGLGLGHPIYDLTFERV